MASRRRSRERALQILFQWDIRKLPVEECISAFYENLHSEDEEFERLPYDRFMEDLAAGAASRATEIDSKIEQHSQNWRIDRMPVVDRNILRLSIFELLSRTSPPAVVIDEALELARRFSGDEAVSFVNGVLDAIHRELDQPPPRV
jgi:transcription antitermination protein NusB